MSTEWVFVIVVGALIVGGWLGVFCERIHAPMREARRPAPPGLGDIPIPVFEYEQFREQAQTKRVLH